MANNYFSYNYEGTPFALFSTSHFIMLVITLLCILSLYYIRNNKNITILKLFILFGLIASELTLNIWYVVNGVWDMEYSLPLQLCSISLYLSIFMLLTEKYRLFEVTFFLGIGGAIQALITPELYYDFPHYRYFHFFIAHISIILASLYMVFVNKYKPTFRSIWKSMIVVNVIACIVFFINKLTGGNYMFLARKPTNASLIDLLGDYPWYLLSLELIAFMMFVIIYLPFIVRKKLFS